MICCLAKDADAAKQLVGVAKEEVMANIVEPLFVRGTVLEPTADEPLKVRWTVQWPTSTTVAHAPSSISVMCTSPTGQTVGCGRTARSLRRRANRFERLSWRLQAAGGAKGRNLHDSTKGSEILRAEADNKPVGRGDKFGQRRQCPRA